MNLENLISKYLDGELSISEDRYLRDLIAEDLEAKEAFEDAVEVHYMLKQDSASIKIPRDLVSETEDKILMRILSDIPDFDEAKKNNKLIDLKRILAPMMLLLISFGIYNVNDFYRSNENIILGEFEINSQDESSRIVKAKSLKARNIFKQNTDVIENEIPSTPQLASIGISQISNPEKQLPHYEDQEFSNEIIIEKDVEQEVNNNLNSTIFTNSFVSEYNSLNFNSLATSSAQRNGVTSLPTLQMNYKEGFDIKNLNTTSFASTDLFRGGIDPSIQTLVSSISQSVAYQLDEKSSVGFEFGFTEYAFTRNNVVTIPYNQLDSYAGEITGDRTKNGLRTNVSLQQNRQMLWASFFYGKNLINYNRLSLYSRVGFGASNYGPMSFSKLLMNIKLFNGVDLTAGLDARVFKWDLSTFDGHKLGVRSSLSFVYGLNVSL